MHPLRDRHSGSLAHQIAIDARGGTRTLTGLPAHRILSPVRLFPYYKLTDQFVGTKRLSSSNQLRATWIWSCVSFSSAPT